MAYSSIGNGNGLPDLTPYYSVVRNYWRRFESEETRMHVHVGHADGVVKIWMAPNIEIAKNLGLDLHQVRTALDIVHEHQEEIREAWDAHFAT